jgi:hypothetical protein
MAASPSSLAASIRAEATPTHRSEGAAAGRAGDSSYRYAIVTQRQDGTDGAVGGKGRVRLLMQPIIRPKSLFAAHSSL